MGTEDGMFRDEDKEAASRLKEYAYACSTAHVWNVKRSYGHSRFVALIQCVILKLYYAHERLYRNSVVSSRDLLMLEFKRIMEGEKGKYPTEWRKADFYFDESLWPPTEPERYMRIGRLCISAAPETDYFIFEIDFSKPIREGVSLVNEEGSIPVDIFCVHFFDDGCACPLCALQSERNQLRECLEALHAVQNGCPLPKYEAEWTAAMERASELLGLK